MENDLRFLWDAAPIGLAKVSKDGHLLSVNPRFAEIVGYSSCELIQKTFQQITHPDDLDADVSEAAALASDPDKRYYQMVKRYLSKDGRVVWASLHVFAFRDSDDKFLHFIVFVTELTPVNIASGSSTDKRLSSSEKRVTLLEYIKNNPKEAVAVASAITLLTQGRSIIEVLQALISK